MKKYTLHYTQSNDLQLEVEAKDKEDARNKGYEIMENTKFEDLMEKTQMGYFECWGVEENETN